MEGVVNLPNSTNKGTCNEKTYNLYYLLAIKPKYMQTEQPYLQVNSV